MNPVSASPKVVRPLGGLEWLQWSQRINLVFAAAVAGPLTANLLRRALEAVQRRHPLLRVSVTDGPAHRPCFRGTETSAIPLRLVSAPAEAWTAEAEHELQRPFVRAEAPLVRCALVQHSGERATLLLSLSHAIADGRVGGFLLRDLLSAASAAYRYEPAALEALPLRPPAEAYVLRVPDRRRVWQRLTEGWRSFRAAAAAGRPMALPPEPDLAATRPAYRIVLRQLPPAHVSALLERARNEQATVHGALCAAQLLAVADEFPDRAAVPLYLVCPVNLQGRVASPVSDDVLLFASGLDCLHRVARDQPFWELAGHLARRFRRGASQLDVIATVRSLQIVHSLQRWLPTDETRLARWLRWAERLAPPLNVVTNMGVLKVPVNYDPFLLESFGFFVNTPATALLSSAATLNGCLFWNFVYRTSVLSVQRAERLADRALQRLRESFGPSGS